MCLSACLQQAPCRLRLCSARERQEAKTDGGSVPTCGKARGPQVVRSWKHRRSPRRTSGQSGPVSDRMIGCTYSLLILRPDGIQPCLLRYGLKNGLVLPFCRNGDCCVRRSVPAEPRYRPAPFASFSGEAQVHDYCLTVAVRQVVVQIRRLPARPAHLAAGALLPGHWRHGFRPKKGSL